MYFKIEPTTQLFHDITTLREKGFEADEAAIAWIKDQFGEFYSYIRPLFCLWGGIEGVKLPEKPDKWKSLQKPYRNFFFPKSTQKQLVKELEELPRIKEKDFNELIGYGNYSGSRDGKLIMSHCPGFIVSKDIILIETSEISHGKYEPVEGMTEILTSEYNRLYKVALPTFNKENPAF